MAHIQIRDVGDGTMSIVINGTEFAFETYIGDIELVAVGGDAKDPVNDELFSEVGLRLTIAVSRLDINDDLDVPITDRIGAVNQAIRDAEESARQVLDGEKKPRPGAVPLVEPDPYPTAIKAHGGDC